MLLQLAKNEIEYIILSTCYVIITNYTLDYHYSHVKFEITIKKNVMKSLLIYSDMQKGLEDYFVDLNFIPS